MGITTGKWDRDWDKGREGEGEGAAKTKFHNKQLQWWLAYKGPKGASSIPLSELYRHFCWLIFLSLVLFPLHYLASDGSLSVRYYRSTAPQAPSRLAWPSVRSLLFLASPLSPSTSPPLFTYKQISFSLLLWPVKTQRHCWNYGQSVMGLEVAMNGL